MDKVQILVVEDERIVALDIESRLRAMGYAVMAPVASGESAIEKAIEADNRTSGLVDVELCDQPLEDGEMTRRLSDKLNDVTSDEGNGDSAQLEMTNQSG